MITIVNPAIFLQLNILLPLMAIVFTLFKQYTDIASPLSKQLFFRF